MGSIPNYRSLIFYFMTKIERAQAYAHKAHDSINQVRKYTGEPYWVHTDEVAAIVSSVVFSEDMVCAAHLHDVLEDVWPILNGFNFSVIEQDFGSHVAEMVLDLTDQYTKEACPDLNRKKRKHLERLRIGLITPASKTIKLADLISNTKSIVEHDRDFANVYLREKWELLPYLENGSSILFEQARQAAIDGLTKLGLTDVIK